MDETTGTGQARCWLCGEPLTVNTGARGSSGAGWYCRDGAACRSRQGTTRLAHRRQEAGELALAACAGDGATDPILAVEHLLDAFLLGDRLPREEFEAVKRLLSGLRAAQVRAKGGAE